ncbi:MAG: hypothetical protein RLZZ532_3695 [Cyanobacteriota bacterium]
MDSLSQIQAILESTTFEEVHDSAETFSAFLELAQSALDQEDREVLGEEEMDDVIAEGIEDFASTLYQIFGIDVEESRMEDEGEMEEYAQNMGYVASFSQGFGQTLAGLIEQRFNSIDDGVAVVSEITGLDGRDISSLFDGTLAIEPETAAELADAFQLNGQDYNDFVNLAANAFTELGGSPNDSYSLSEGIHAEPVVTMNADIGLRAEFEALKEQQAIGETLRAIERQCDQMIAAGILTTHERRLLIGEFETGQDRTAQFSSACEGLSVPPGQQLDRLQYYLYIANARGPIAQFGQMANDPIDTDFSHEDVQSIQSFRTRNGYV